MRIILLDLDNCISDDKWRRHLVDSRKDHNERYHLYHLRAIYDALGNAHLLDTPHDIVICTGRPARYRETTMKWLAKQEITPRAVLMRDDGDHRPASVSKIDLVQRYLIQTNHTIVHAYDDRADVIQAYRTMGLEATQWAIHQEEVPLGH